MIAIYGEVTAFARGKLLEAKGPAQVIRFSAEEYAKSASLGSTSIRASLQDDPRLAAIPNAYGMAAFSTVLAVDLRGSSARAVRIGAKDTYLTMHTFLPTMIHLVECAGGIVVGLRGDGLFASFGLTPRIDDDTKWEDGPESVREATRCGKAMIEAAEEVV